MTYIELMQKPGKQIHPKVYYFNDANEKVTFEYDDIIQAKPFFNAPIVGTVMKGFSLELSSKLPNKPIYFSNTVKYDGVSATKTFGPYYLKETPEFNADSKTYTHSLCDNFINTMKEYKPITINYPCTVLDFFKRLCIECGFTTNITSLPNGSRIIESDIYENIGFTYRDVYEDIGQATATLFKINNLRIEKCTFGNDEIKIDDDLLKNQNIKMGEHFGPINSIILSRSADADIIYKRDESLTKWNEFKIVDNQLMNNNNRSEYLQELYDSLCGIQFDIYDLELIGYGGFEPLQKIKIVSDNQEYSSYIFNNEQVFTDGFEESIFNDMPEENESNYKVSDTEDKKLNQAYIILNKQEKRLDALLSETTENTSKITSLEMDLNGVKTSVEETNTQIANLSELKATVEGNNELIIEDALEADAIEYKVKGKSEQEMTTQSANILEISDKRFLFKSNSISNENLSNNSIKTIYVAENGKTYQNIEFNLPNERLSSGTWYLGGKLSQFGSPDEVILNLSAFTKETTNRVFWKEVHFTASNINTNKYISFTLTENDIANNRFEIRLYANTTASGETGTNYTTIWEDLYLSKINQFVPFIPNSPSPNYPSKVKSIEGIENLLNKNSIERYYSYSYGNVGVIPNIQASSNTRGTLSPSNGIKIKPNTKYTLTIPNGFRFAVAQLESDLKSLGDTGWLTSSNSPYTLTTKPNAKYIGFNFGKDDNTSFSDDEWDNFINGNLQFEEGTVANSYVPYGRYLKINNNGENNEENVILIPLGDNFIGSIGNVKDELEVINGKAILHKKINKIDLETLTWQKMTGVSMNLWISNNIPNIKYTSLNNELGNGIAEKYKMHIGKGMSSESALNTMAIDVSQVTVNETNSPSGLFYYELSEPYDVELGNFNISLRQGYNKLTLVEDLETNTEVTYLKDNVLNEEFARQLDLDITNGELNNTKNNLSNLNTDVYNNYQDLLSKVNDKVSNEMITQINQKVEETISSTEWAVNKVEEIIVNGATQVKTGNGMTFNDDGLNFDREGAQVGSSVDEAGMKIVDKTGASNSILQYTGFVTDEIANEVPELSKSKGSVVNYAKEYFFSEKIRGKYGQLEEVEDDEFGKGWAIFVGGDE